MCDCVERNYSRRLIGAYRPGSCVCKTWLQFWCVNDHSGCSNQGSIFAFQFFWPMSFIFLKVSGERQRNAVFFKSSVLEIKTIIFISQPTTHLYCFYEKQTSLWHIFHTRQWQEIGIPSRICRRARDQGPRSAFRQRASYEKFAKVSLIKLSTSRDHA